MPAWSIVVPAVILHLFGPFEACVNGVPLPRLRSRKGHWLLALLALRPGREVERSWLAGTLWADSSPELAARSLRTSLTDLRNALGAEAARLRSPTPRTLSLDLAGADVDVVAFDQALARGDRGSLEEAIALYRGPLLEGCVEEWVLQERDAREQGYLQALEALAGEAVTRGEPAKAEHYLRSIIAVDPLRESAHRALMQTLGAAGNYAAALHTYRELRLRLHRELHAEPDAETAALFRRLREEARDKAALGSGLWALSTDGGQLSLPRAAALPTQSPEPRAQSWSEATLTFLFTDIEGSVALWEEHPGAMQQALARHDALLRREIEANGGVVFKTVGDQFCAAFATAPDALRAALAGQRALQAMADQTPGPLRVRMALHTGVAEERDGDYFGPPLNRVARLLDAGHGGQILLSLATQELARDQLPEDAHLRDLGRHRLKDLVRPEQIFQLVAADLDVEFPPIRVLDAQPNNLPVQLSSFLGREREVLALRQLLLDESVRLVTLTGVGGTGKTRLGLQVAAELIDTFADGVFFVELAPIREPELVISTILQALALHTVAGRTPEEGLKNYLREKSLLLVLDNFEQVLSAAPVVTELLAAALRLKILVTSRGSLRLRGEREFSVPPLELPDRKRLPPLEKLSQYAAVRLFVERAVAVQPEFAITNASAPAVAEICHRLDGLPLAIELAAARVRLLPPEALLARMQTRLQVLTGGPRDLPARQQTLRNTISWSHDLLEESEQRLFRRLAVFVGAFTVEAAEAVCGADGEHAGVPPLGIDPLDGLASLLDKNLLLQQSSPERSLSAARPGELGSEPISGNRDLPPRSAAPRLMMLETIREYAWERLAESSEAEALRRRHAEHFMALAERAEPAVLGPEQKAWRDYMEEAHDNLRAALDWAVESGAGATGLRIAGALRVFWGRRGHTQEGRKRLPTLLALPEAAARTLVRAKALHCASACTHYRWYGNHDRAEIEAARAYLDESLSIYREHQNDLGAVAVLESLGHLCQSAGDLEEARRRFEESLALSRERDDRRGIARCLQSLGLLSEWKGENERAPELYRESLAVWRALGYRWATAFPLHGLSDIALHTGDLEAAWAGYEECLAIRRESGEDFTGTLDCLGEMAYHQGRYDAARALFDEALTIHRDRGDRHGWASQVGTLAEVALYQGNVAEARSLYEQRLAIFREFANRMATAGTLRELGMVAYTEGELETATAHLDESLAICHELEAEGPGIEYVIVHSMTTLAEIASMRGDYETAERLVEEAMPLWPKVHLPRGAAYPLRVRGRAALARGEVERAASLLAESLRLRRTWNDRRGIAECLESLAAVSVARGQPEQAARLSGAATALRETIGAPLPPVEHADWERTLAAARTALGETEFQAAWAAGQVMDTGEAVAAALEAS